MVLGAWIGYRWLAERYSVSPVLDQTINQEMPKEARYLLSIRMTRARIKEVIEGPDSDIDRIIRSIRDSHGKISNKLLKEFPMLNEVDVGSEIIKIVQEELMSLSEMIY